MLVIGWRAKGGQGKSRAEQSELRKRVGKMVGVGRKDLGGSPTNGQGSSEAPVRVAHSRLRSTPSAHADLSRPLQRHQVTFITAAQLATALCATRPSVPEQERDRLRRIYGAFVDDRSVDGLEGAEGGGTAVGSRSSLG